MIFSQSKAAEKVGKSSMASVLLAGKLKAPNLPFKTTSAAKCISKTARPNETN